MEIFCPGIKCNAKYYFTYVWQSLEQSDIQMGKCNFLIYLNLFYLLF